MGCSRRCWMRHVFGFVLEAPRWYRRQCRVSRAPHHWHHTRAPLAQPLFPWYAHNTSSRRRDTSHACMMFVLPVVLSLTSWLHWHPAGMQHRHVSCRCQYSPGHAGLVCCRLVHLANALWSGLVVCHRVPSGMVAARSTMEHLLCARSGMPGQHHCVWWHLCPVSKVWHAG